MHHALTKFCEGGMNMLEIKVLGSTSVGYEIPTDKALDFSAKMAGLCYMPDKYETIMNEPIKNTLRRVSQTLESGHHSVYDHVTFNLLLTNIPKILAMILNNEGMYTTSEKSARYTKMKPSPREKELYDKWYDIFVKKITEMYGEKYYNYNYRKNPEKAEKNTKEQIGKLAQENARYMISVFTPTTMAYTVSLRQLNYLRSWFERFIGEAHEYLPNNFAEKIKQAMREFLNATQNMSVEHLDAKVKDRRISLFDLNPNTHKEYFGEVYATTYLGSFAELAQAQRHRTLRYKMRFLKKDVFYIPEIIENDDLLAKEWIDDIKSVASVYPQGMLVEILERGTCEDFVLKTKERLCGCPQLEIAKQTQETMRRYIDTVKYQDSEIYKYMRDYSHGPRCTFPCWKCTSPCIWGAGEALTRKI